MLDIFYDKKKGGEAWIFLAIQSFYAKKYRTLGAYMRLQTPERALLFTHCTIKWPIPPIPSSRSSH